MKLVVALATRGRPAIVVESILKTLENVTDSNTELWVLVDEDDEPTIALLGAKWSSFGGQTKLSVKPREDTVGAKWNRVMETSADLYMPMADHTYPTTKGFDAKINEAAQRYPDGICAVHTHMANFSFAAMNALSAKWVEIVGQIYPTYFPYWFVDHWTDDLARMIDRIAFADVGFDDTRKPPTQEMREPGWWATWYDAARDLRRRQAEKLIEAMDEPMGRKANCLTCFPWIEARSRWINDNVRVQDRQLTWMSDLSLTEPRYVRLKAKAVAMVPELLSWFAPAEAEAYRKILAPPTMAPNIPQAFAPPAQNGYAVTYAKGA